MLFRSHKSSASQIPGDEGQHAWLKIYVPEEYVEQIDDLVSDRAYDILIDEGYDIAVIAIEKSSLQSTATVRNDWEHKTEEVINE